MKHWQELSADLATRLACETLAELAADKLLPRKQRTYDGKAKFAAEYVYFCHVREGRIGIMSRRVAGGHIFGIARRVEERGAA